MYDVSTHGVSAEMTFDVFKTKNHAILVSYNFGPVINEQQISAKSLFQIKINVCTKI